ncbi:MAG: VanZ family protein [Fusobacteriaceae bacterium]
MNFKKKYINRYLVIVLTIMATIFFLSHSSGEVSTKHSRFVMVILSYLPINIDIDGEHMGMISLIVRKTAHMTEYFLLTLSIYRYLLSIEKERIYIYSGLIAFLYACSDEFHQTFIPGRAGMFRDVLVDSVGIFVALLGAYLIKKYLKSQER